MTKWYLLYLWWRLLGVGDPFEDDVLSDTLDICADRWWDVPSKVFRWWFRKDD